MLIELHNDGRLLIDGDILTSAMAREILTIMTVCQTIVERYRNRKVKQCSGKQH